MKKIRTIMLLLCIHITSYAFDNHATIHVEEANNDDGLVEELDTILAKQKDNTSGLSILVRKDNKVVLKKSKGLANQPKNIPISANTGFRIGSMSKPFTALAIMQLVEQGKISLDHSVTKYINALPSYWEKITIRHLLSHRVYISDDFFSDANIALANQSTNQTLLDFLSSPQINVSALASDKARYCNTCYVLLAEIITEASKEKFSDYLQNHIFTPAHMTHSYIVEQGVTLKQEDALNYAISDTFFDIMQFTTGAMAQVSNIEDLNQFIIALKSGKVVSPNTLAQMTSVQADMGEDGLYGFGWIIGWGEQPFFSHGGSQDGYQSELFFYPKYNLEIVILSNGGDNTYELQGQIIRQVINHYRT